MKLFAELGYAVVKDRWETRKQENTVNKHD